MSSGADDGGRFPKHLNNKTAQQKPRYFLPLKKKSYSYFLKKKKSIIMPGLLIRMFHFHIGPGMIFAEYSRRGTGALARSIFNDRAFHSQNVSSFSRQV